MRLTQLSLCCVFGVFFTGCAASVTSPTASPSSQAAQSATSTVMLSAQATETNAVSANPPADCPVTRPQQPVFVAPPPNQGTAPWPDQFWYGTESLWTALPRTGVWSGLPHNPPGFTQKVFWWRKGYRVETEPEPQLSVSGRRVDAPAPPLNVSKATNAGGQDIQSAMLVGVDFPTLGCWEITGHYAGTELSFIVWVAP